MWRCKKKTYLDHLATRTTATSTKHLPYTILHLHLFFKPELVHRTLVTGCLVTRQHRRERCTTVRSNTRLQNYGREPSQDASCRPGNHGKSNVYPVSSKKYSDWFAAPRHFWGRSNFGYASKQPSPHGSDESCRDAYHALVFSCWGFVSSTLFA